GEGGGGVGGGAGRAHEGGAGGGRDLAGLDLRLHATAGEAGARGTRHGFDLGRDFRDQRNALGVGVRGRRAVIEAVDVGEQDQKIGAHHGGDARGETV